MTRIEFYCSGSILGSTRDKLNRKLNETKKTLKEETKYKILGVNQNLQKEIKKKI